MASEVAFGILLAVFAYFIILSSVEQREDNPCSSYIQCPVTAVHMCIDFITALLSKCVDI